MTPPAGAAVAVENAGKTFGRISALRGVTLKVEPGEAIAITGRSGSGKSTLLSLIGGLQQPDEGEVLIDGRALERRLGACAYMPQRDALLPWRRTLDNVTIGLEREQRALPGLAPGLRHPPHLEAGAGAGGAHHAASACAGGRQRITARSHAATSPKRTSVRPAETITAPNTRSARKNCLDTLM